MHIFNVTSLLGEWCFISYDSGSSRCGSRFPCRTPPPQFWRANCVTVPWQSCLSRSGGLWDLMKEQGATRAVIPTLVRAGLGWCEPAGLSSLPPGWTAAARWTWTFGASSCPRRPAQPSAKCDHPCQECTERWWICSWKSAVHQPSIST